MKAAESSLLNLKKYIRFMFSISDRAEVKVVKKPKRNIFERKKFQERKKKTNEKKLQKEQLKRLHQYYNAIKKTTTITNNLTIRMEAKKIHLKWNYLYGVCVCGTTPEILFMPNKTSIRCSFTYIIIFPKNSFAFICSAMAFIYVFSLSFFSFEFMVLSIGVYNDIFVFWFYVSNTKVFCLFSQHRH